MGRPIGSKNRSTLPAGMLEEAAQQDEDFVQKDNTKVLGVANGVNGESTDEEEEDSEDEWLPSLTPTASSPSSRMSASQPSKSTSKPAAKSTLVQFAQPKVAKPRVKKPLDAVLLVERNLELFKRGLESRQNSQFELLNDNFRSFSSRVGASERELTRTVNELKEALTGFINFNTNNSLLAIQRHNGGMKKEPSFDDDLVCLDSPPSVSAKTPFSYIQPKAEPFESSKSNFHCSSEPFTTNQQQYNGYGATIGAASRDFGNYSTFKQPFQPRMSSQNVSSSSINSSACSSNSNNSKTGFSVIKPYKFNIEELVAATCRFHEITRVTVAAFNWMWKSEIACGMFNDGAYNVYGVSANGGAGVAKQGLDSGRVMLLQKFVQDKMEPGQDKETVWRKCVTAIHKRLYQLKHSQGAHKENPKVKEEDDEKAFIYC